MKVNLHIIEGCNYRCKHCFAHFNLKGFFSISIQDWRKVIDNCLDSGMVDYFNIAGGEPMLCPYLRDIVEYIREKGIKCSLITNGSFITEKWIEENTELYDTIGISVDSFEEKTNIILGRHNYNGNVISFEKLKFLFEKIKEVNPNCNLKINTVVSSLNKDENICRYIKQLPVCRYKILKMLEYEDKDFSNKNIKIDDIEFYRFLNNNLSELGIHFQDSDKDAFVYQLEDKKIVIEKTTKSSYIIISPNGLLLDNSYDSSYEYKANLLYEDFGEAIKKISFSEETYSARYE